MIPRTQMNPNPNDRPTNPAPVGMGGTSRMHDPSEEAHDRVRRRLMNTAFVVIVVLTVIQVTWIGAESIWNWLLVLTLIVAAIPLGVTVKLLDLRFKMAPEERRIMLGDIPTRRVGEWLVYCLLVAIVVVLNGSLVVWALWGVWLYDFVTYYHDRPQRMRHVYAVAMILDEFREFPRPWLWTLPSLALTIFRLTHN